MIPRTSPAAERVRMMDAYKPASNQGVTDLAPGTASLGATAMLSLRLGLTRSGFRARCVRTIWIHLALQIHLDLHMPLARGNSMGFMGAFQPFRD